jgi:hypothetical protein
LSTSIPPVISLNGSLASKPLRIDYKNTKKVTLESMLGAFLLTRDAVTIKESAAYAMLALARNERITCISCGYPTLRGFAPDKHQRFDRMLTCSQGCWYTHAHYKDMDDILLKTKTVKTVMESIQAASAYVIKTIRGTNGEEVLGGTGTEAQKAALSNVDHLTNSFISLITFAWNGVRVGWTLNERLGKTERFSSLVPEIPIMGHVMPQFIKKTAGPKSCSSVLLHLNGKVDQDWDVTKKST